MLINKIKLKMLDAGLGVYGLIFIQSIAVYLYLTQDKITILRDKTSLKISVFVLSTFLIKMVIMAAISYGMAALTAQKPPKPTHAKPAGLEQFDIPTAEEGRPMQILFGKKYIAGPNVIWYGDLKIEKIIKRM